MKARLPQNMQTRGASNMNDMMRQAQTMQTKITELTEEIEQRTFDIAVGGGMVSIKMKGNKEVLDISINPEVVDPDDIETLQDLIISAFNAGITQINTTTEEEMSKITGGVSFPGLF
ncbi:MAG: YbaB/EbfC family nucleoid-associated protein [Ruminococcus sp.]|nr:YbaB/EbfC family nucleoid-associated protein [Ruminococcus sp.]